MRTWVSSTSKREFQFTESSLDLWERERYKKEMDPNGKSQKLPIQDRVEIGKMTLKNKNSRWYMQRHTLRAPTKFLHFCNI